MTTNINNTPSVLDEILDSITPEEQYLTDQRMQLAAYISDCMKEAKCSKSDLARRVNQHPSVITKWLSGTHNFTSDTLWLIGKALNIDLLPTSKPIAKSSSSYVVEFKIVSNAISQNSHVNLVGGQVFPVAIDIVNLTSFAKSKSFIQQAPYAEC